MRSTRSAVYYVALLRFVGCTSDASEMAVLAGGDDIALLRTMAPMAMAQPGEGMRYFVAHLAEDLPLHRRVGRVVRALTDPGWERRSLSGHCEVAARLAARLGLAEPVRYALAHAYERWDGKGLPDGLAGEEVPVAIACRHGCPRRRVVGSPGRLVGCGRGARSPAGARL